MGTMLLTIAVPASESDGPIEMYVSEDETIPRQGGSQAGSDAVHLDLFGAAKEVLWMCSGINDMVKTALDRMEKAFAYNYVFFLKVALDLQTTYHSLSQQPPAGVFLETGLVLRIAKVLAERMVRKDKDGASPSRELQLRTLVSALSLLYQLRIGQLDKEVYAALLKGISERDSDTRAKCTNAAVGDSKNSNGDSEFLVRHARDLIRRMSNDLPNFPRVNPQVTHYLFAAGYINQLECAMTSTALDNMWAGIIAPPSEWHRDMQHLYEGTAGAISLHHQVQYSSIGRASQYASNLAAEIARSIVDKTEHALQAPDGGSGEDSDGAKEIPSLETKLLVCGLLDLLCQLVTTFPHSDEIVRDAKALALKLIRTSNKKEFRNKAFEIMISTTAGCCEDEYYNIMRNLDLEIESFAQTGTPTAANKDLVLESEGLKREKREAMDRCEKRSILYKGAVESMQRRYQGFRTGRSRRRTSQTIDQVLEMKRWDEQLRSATAVSPAPSSLRSQVPTLSSQAPTCDTNNSPTSTPIYESGLGPTGVLLSPTDSTTCQTLSSPTDSSCHTLLSRARYDDSPLESPILPSLTPPNMTPSTPYPAPTTPHEAITPNLDTTLRFSRLGQLFSDAMFEEPELYDDGFPSESNERKISVDLSIQSFSIDDDDASTLPLQIPEEGEEEDKEGEERKEETADSERTQIMNYHPRISILSQTPIEPPLPSPISTYPEPSLSRTPSGLTQVGSLKRQSRASKIFSRRPRSFIRDRRFHSVQLNKPLPEIDKETVLAEDAPEPVVPGLPAQPVRSQSAFEMRNDKLDYFHLESPSAVSLLYANKNKPGLRPTHCDAEPVLTTANSLVDYDSQPIEHVFKVQPKDSCFSTVVSSDAKHAVFMSPHVFQVFSIPTPGESTPTKPKFTYRLGSNEGIRRAKVLWTYKAVAASDKYIVTITKDRIQVHDLEECKVIFTESTTGWENTCVTIVADKLAVGMSKRRRDDTQGALRIYKMNAPTYKGSPCDRVRDVLLPTDVQDAPHLVSLTQDGNNLTCGTPKYGHFFSWDISRILAKEPSLIAKGGLRVTEGPGAERLSATILFPDKKHIFCSTFPASTTGAEWGGSFTEPTTPPATSSSSSSSSDPPSRCLIRQVGIRVTHSALAPLGNAAAFLTKSGIIWVTPVTLLDGDNNLTTFFPINTKERLQNQQVPETAGRIAFTPEGDRLVGVDRKGKILTLSFGKKPDLLKIKTEVGGFF